MIKSYILLIIIIKIVDLNIKIYIIIEKKIQKFKIDIIENKKYIIKL